MIEYIIAHNPDTRILDKASTILKAGGVICFPTDTNWVMAVDPFQKDTSNKLHKLKGEDETHHFSMLCDSIQKASDLALIDNNAFKMLKRLTPGHYTFIFHATKKTCKAIKASKADHQIGVRFVPSELVSKLIEYYGEALMTTNLTPQMLGIEEAEDIYSFLIEESLGNKIDLILDPGEFEFVGPSTIIDFSDEMQGPVLIREGAGSF